MINKRVFCNAEDIIITMVQGDTMSFNFSIKGLGGTASQILFTCREKLGNLDYIFMKALNDGVSLISYDDETDEAIYCVRVNPADTVELTPALYYYDLALINNGDRLTLLRGRLNLIYSVLNY